MAFACIYKKTGVLREVRAMGSIFFSHFRMPEFQNLKACQANREERMHFMAAGPISALHNVVFMDSHPIKCMQEGWFGRMTKFSTLQDITWVSILGKANLIYNGLEEYEKNIVSWTLLPWLNTLQMIHQSLYQSNSLKATIHGWC